MATARPSSRSTAQGAINLSSGTLTQGSSNLSTTSGGPIIGSGGSLVKAGSGTWLLSGTNSFTGPVWSQGGLHQPGLRRAALGDVRCRQHLGLAGGGRTADHGFLLQQPVGGTVQRLGQLDRRGPPKPSRSAGPSR